LAISDSAFEQGRAARLRALDERYRQDLKAGLERIRFTVTANVPPRDQWRFLSPIDIIEQNLSRETFDIEAVRREIQQAKGSTRRFLAGRHVTMSEILNSLDGLEQEVMDFFNEVLGRAI
jgi:hypothetical protein